MIITGANLISACTVMSATGSLADFLLGLGTVDSLHWAEAGITLETGVSAQADQSGNGHTVANSTGAEQPLVIANGIGGKPALRYDGTADFLVGSWARPQPHTSLTVLVPSRSASIAKFCLDGQGQWMTLDCFTATTLRYFGDVDNITATSNIDAAQLVTRVSDGASSSIQVNNGPPGTGNAPSAPGGLTMGSAWSGSSNHADTDISLNIIYIAITAPNLALAQAALNVHYTLF